MDNFLFDDGQEEVVGIDCETDRLFDYVDDSVVDDSVADDSVVDNSADEDSVVDDSVADDSLVDEDEVDIQVEVVATAGSGRIYMVAAACSIDLKDK